MASVRSSLVFLTIFLSCLFRFSVSVAQFDLLHQECQHFQETFQPRCVGMLSSNPEASKATDLKTLAIIGLELAKQNTTNFMSQVHAAAARNGTGDGSRTLKSCLRKVYKSFAKAENEVKENDIANVSYDVFNARDYVLSCEEKLRNVEGTVDPFFENGLAFLNDFALINSVIINDMNVS